MTPSSLLFAPTAALVAAGLAACQPSPPPAALGFVTTWTDTHYGLARAERLSPPVASRTYVYGAIALYEGWAALSDSLRSFSGQLNGFEPLPPPPAGRRHDAALVGLEAQTVVVQGLYRDGFPSTQTAILQLRDSLVQARRAQGVTEATAAASAEYGQVIGRAILAWADSDGFTATRDRSFVMPVGPQYWVPTATAAQFRSRSLSGASAVVEFDNPASNESPGQLSERALILAPPKVLGTTFTPGIDPTKPVEPYWGELRPFALPHADTCQAPLPVPFSPSSGSAFHEQAQKVHDVGRHLTPEQFQTAQFWADNPGESGTPAGHWMGIVSHFAEQHHLSPERAVEAYAMVAIATADAFIACWHLKYQLNLVRPVTYIQRYIDPGWQTVIITPPFPEYASGHAIQSAASAEVLSALFGDETPFEDVTHVSLGHPPRQFPSFRAAAEEAMMSRLYGGIHYPMGNENGAMQGRCIGQTVLHRVETRSDAEPGAKDQP